MAALHTHSRCIQPLLEHFFALKRKKTENTASLRVRFVSFTLPLQEGAEEAFSLLKSVTAAANPANDDLRTALRSVVGSIVSQADSLSIASLVEALSLLTTWRLLSDSTALGFVTAILRRFEVDTADGVLVSSCAAALVQLRSIYGGTDAQKVTEASANSLTGTYFAVIHCVLLICFRTQSYSCMLFVFSCWSPVAGSAGAGSFVFDGDVAATDASTTTETGFLGQPRAPRSVPGQLRSASQQVLIHHTPPVCPTNDNPPSHCAAHQQVARCCSSREASLIVSSMKHKRVTDLKQVPAGVRPLGCNGSGRAVLRQDSCQSDVVLLPLGPATASSAGTAA
jgi:hypothetical protein